MVEEHDFSTFTLDDFGDGGHGSEPATATADAPPAVDPRMPGGAAIAVVDADQAVRDYLAQQLGEGVGAEPSLVELEQRFGMGPIVVVLGPSCATPTDFAMIERWSRTNPEVGSVLVTSELTTELLQTALRAGVKDVLSAPIDQMQLVDTVGRVADGLSGVPIAPTTGAPTSLDDLEAMEGEPGKVITVFSTKGGSGKSVTATNLACALARRSTRPVVLIDGHLQFGDVAVMLQLAPQHTVVDAVSQMDKIDAVLLKDLLTVHSDTGLLVLPAPLEPTFADQIGGDQMRALVEIIRSFAGHVIIDLPAIFNDVVLSLIEGSDEVVLVAGLDIPNIKNVKIGLSTLALLNVPKEKLHLVLNRADSRVKLDVGEVEKTLQIRAAAHVPSDVVVPISVNRGEPVVLSAAKSGVAQAFEQLALRFLDGAAEVQEKSSSRRRFFG